jgi:galactose mutarotase-like enzyme
MVLKSDRGERGLTFTFKGFPYMGIWTKPGPFICLEPWFGIADFEDADGRFEHKEGLCRLAAGQAFAASYSIHFF